MSCDWIYIIKKNLLRIKAEKRRTKKMKKMKKIICLAMSAAMLLGVAGCGGAEKTATEDVPTLIYCVAGNPQADLEEVEAAINEIIEPKIQAKVDIQIIDWGAYREKMNMKLTAGEYFDIAYGGFDVGTARKNGALLPLDDLIDEYCSELKASLPDYIWDAAKADGVTYYIPNYQCEAYSKAVAVRKDIAEKYNFDVSKVNKIGDLEPLWQQVRDNEPTLIPFRMNNLDHFIIDATGKDFGTTQFMNSMMHVDWNDCKVHTALDDDYLYKRAKIAYEWMQKGYFRADIATVTDDSSDYASGRYATFDTSYKPGNEAEIKNQTGYDYIIKEFTTAKIEHAMPLATKTIINEATKYPEKSMQFINLLNTDKEVYNLICFGIEGKHYTKLDDGKIRVNTSGGYCPNSSWEFGNQFNAYVQEGQDEDVWEKTIETNENAEVSPLMGIEIVTDDFLTEMTQCLKIQKEYGIARMEKGVTDPDSYWDEYKAALEKAGVKKIQESYQKQIDEFLKNNK